MEATIKAYLLENIGQARYEHSLRVRKVAMDLAQAYGLDLEKAALAAILHDCGKIRDQEELLKKAQAFDIILDEILLENTELIHAGLGAEIARRELHVEDRDILNAISYHTTGRPGMSQLEKLIFLADYMEPMRNFPGVEKVRELAYKDLDQAVLQAMDQTLNFLVAKRLIISPITVEARNSFLINKLGG